MYLMHKGTRYPCSRRTQNRDTVTFYGLEGLQNVEGGIELYADDGFALADYDTGDWLRVVIAGTTLTLTQLPEPAPPEPQPEPEPQSDPIADLAELIIDHEYRIALMELGG